jgi:hypothetical protein
MTFGGRLRRAEEKAGGTLRCSGCGLRPQNKGYIVVDGNDPVPHIPEVCPKCGRSTRLHIVIVYDGEEGSDFIEVADGEAEGGRGPE